MGQTNRRLWVEDLGVLERNLEERLGTLADELSFEGVLFEEQGNLELKTMNQELGSHVPAEE